MFKFILNNFAQKQLIQQQAPLTNHENEPVDYFMHNEDKFGLMRDNL